MKKPLIFLLCMLLVLSLVSGCSQKQAQRQELQKSEEKIQDTAAAEEKSGQPWQPVQPADVINEENLGIEEPADETYIDGLEESGIDDLQLDDIEGLVTLGE